MIRDISRTVVASATAQVAGLFKALLIAYYFGLDASLDGYYLAQAVPVAIAAILNGVVQTGFVPRYAAALAQGRHQDAQRVVASVMGITVAVGLLATAALTLSAPVLVPLLTGSGPKMEQAAIASLQVLSILVLLNGMVDAYGSILIAHSRFVVAALAPAVAAVSSAILLAIAPEWGLDNLLAGTIGGTLLQIVLLAWTARRAGVRFRWQVMPDFRSALGAGAAILPALLFSNVTLLVPTAIAAHLGEGAVSAFSIAMRLHLAATQAVGIAVSNVLLAKFASAIALGDRQAVVQMLRRGYPFAVLLGLAAVFWVGIAGQAFVSLLLERGAFDAEATQQVATAWLWLTLAIFPTIWGTALAKVLQAMQRGATISLIALAGLLVVAMVAPLAVPTASLAMLGLAAALSMVATTVGCAFVVNRALLDGQSRPGRLPNSVAVSVASVAAAAALYNAGGIVLTPAGLAAVTMAFAAAGAALFVYLRRQL